MDQATIDPESRLEEALRTRIDLQVCRDEIEVAPRLCATISAAHGLLDSLQAAVTDSDPDAASLRAHVQDVERLKRRVEAVELRLLAKASRKKVSEGTGHTSTGSWFSDTTKGDKRRSASDADLADALGDPPRDGASGEGTSVEGGSGDGGSADGVPGSRPTRDGASGDQPGPGSEGPSPDPDSPTPDDPAPDSGSGSGTRPTLGATGGALDRGEISADHAKVILRALDDLPEDITPDERALCEGELLRLAVNRTPAQLRIAGRRIIEQVIDDHAAVDAHEEELVANEEERADEAAAFWIKDNQDGTMTGHFTVPWASGIALKKVIDAMTAPRRRSPDGQESAEDLDRRAKHLDWQHRRGQALADLLLRLPTDHLGHKVAATLLVTMRLGDLRRQVSPLGVEEHSPARLRVGSTDSTEVLSAGAVRRMACGAGIIPTVLGSDSIPVDLGRQARLFTEHQRLALATRYSECAAEGCDRPFAWTEIHHLTAWQHGGATDLDNGVPLCGRHHRMIDGPAWRHRVDRGPDRTARISFTRRT